MIGFEESERRVHVAILLDTRGRTKKIGRIILLGVTEPMLEISNPTLLTATEVEAILNKMRE